MSTIPHFTPVPVRARRDGWTPRTQARFIFELARTRSVAAAARIVDRSWQTAYRLRARPDAASFAAAWDAALAGPDLTRAVSGRAVDGIATPVMYRGCQVGERRRYDNRLATYILRLRAPERFGTAREHRRPFWPGDDVSDDVARGSSPSAPRPASPANAGPRSHAAARPEPLIPVSAGRQRDRRKPAAPRRRPRSRGR